MENTARTNLKLLTHVRWNGAAAMLGAVLLVIATVIFTLTHGTQSEAQNGTLFGLRSAQYSKYFQPTIWLSFLLAVVGVNALQEERSRRLVKAGFVISALGYALATVSWISQTWIVDPDLEFRSIYVQGGFTLWLLSVFIQTAGMILFGIALRRSPTLSGWSALPLMIGLLLLPAGIFQLYIFDASDGSPVWSLVYVSAVLPYAVCWLLLGYRLWSIPARFEPVA